MKPFLIITLALAIVGCASEQVKVDRGNEMIKAGNDMTASTEKLFTQYRATNMEYIKVFLATNVSCDITPDFTVHIRAGAPGQTACLSRDEYDKYRNKATAESGDDRGNKYYTTIKLSYDELLLVTTMNLIDGLTKYMAALQQGLDVKDSTADKLISEAVINIGAVDKILQSVNDSGIANIDTGAFKVADYQDAVSGLFSYLKGLEKAHRQSTNVNQYIRMESGRVNSIFSSLSININNMMLSMRVWKNATDVNKMRFYNLEKNKSKGEFNTLKDRTAMLDAVVSSRFDMSSVNTVSSPVLIAMDSFRTAQENLTNMYSDNLNDENKKKIEDEEYRRITEGLKQAAVIAKILLKAALV
ncbi:hypothetical protein ACSPAH_12580 [Buttiauxella agrestis]